MFILDPTKTGNAWPRPEFQEKRNNRMKRPAENDQTGFSTSVVLVFYCNTPPNDPTTGLPLSKMWSAMMWKYCLTLKLASTYLFPTDKWSRAITPNAISQLILTFMETMLRRIRRHLATFSQNENCGNKRAVVTLFMALFCVIEYYSKAE